jgi:hypothetical protein
VAAEMKSMKLTAKYMWREYKMNYDIKDGEEKTELAMTKIFDYRKKCIRHVDRIQRDTMAKLIMKCKEQGTKEDS